jgi:hypothetical protein
MVSDPKQTTAVNVVVYAREDLEHLMRKDQAVVFRDGITFKWGDYDEVEMIIPKQAAP